MRALLLTLTLFFASTAEAQVNAFSVYTDLSGSKCKTLAVDGETGSSVQDCPGLSGYKLQLLDDDSRQSITVIDPSGKQHELSLWHVITGAFSTVGAKAEWRVVRKGRSVVPFALIVRVNAAEDPEHPNRTTSYLSVSKITDAEICVTHKIKSSAAANALARKAASEAAHASCLKEGS